MHPFRTLHVGRAPRLGASGAVGGVAREPARLGEEMSAVFGVPLRQWALPQVMGQARGGPSLGRVLCQISGTRASLTHGVVRRENNHNRCRRGWGWRGNCSWTERRRRRRRRRRRGCGEARSGEGVDVARGDSRVPSFARVSIRGVPAMRRGGGTSTVRPRVHTFHTTGFQPAFTHVSVHVSCVCSCLSVSRGRLSPPVSEACVAINQHVYLYIPQLRAPLTSSE